MRLTLDPNPAKPAALAGPIEADVIEMAPADPNAAKQSALEKLRPICVARGAAWLRRGVLDRFKVDRLSALSVEQINAVLDEAAAEETELAAVIESIGTDRALKVLRAIA